MFTMYYILMFNTFNTELNGFKVPRDILCLLHFNNLLFHDIEIKREATGILFFIIRASRVTYLKQRSSQQ